MNNENQPLVILFQLCLTVIAAGVAWGIFANPVKNLLDRTLFRGEHRGETRTKAAHQ
jgi:hypothetical protein